MEPTDRAARLFTFEFLWRLSDEDVRLLQNERAASGGALPLPRLPLVPASGSRWLVSSPSGRLPVTSCVATGASTGRPDKDRA